MRYVRCKTNTSKLICEITDVVEKGKIGGDQECINIARGLVLLCKVSCSNIQLW